MLQLLLPCKVELRVPVWLKGIPEQFLVHVQQALDAIRQKGLQKALEKAVKDKEECTKKLTKASEAFENCKGKDENPPKKRAVEKASETVDCKEETMSPSLPRCSSYTPTYFWRKLEGPGARS